jgi:1,4-alpha-glucan branching enzyme
MLLAPAPPLLFMGEEWGTRVPFPFFCNFESGLAALVTEGRRTEFARFVRFSGEASRSLIPDPSSPDTFRSAKLDWRESENGPGAQCLAHYQRLLGLRRTEIVPRLQGMEGNGRYQVLEGGGLRVDWNLGDGSRLHLLCNLTDTSASGAIRPQGRVIYTSHPTPGSPSAGGAMPPWSVVWILETTNG